MLCVKICRIFLQTLSLLKTKKKQNSVLKLTMMGCVYICCIRRRWCNGTSIYSTLHTFLGDIGCPCAIGATILCPSSKTPTNLCHRRIFATNRRICVNLKSPTNLSSQTDDLCDHRRIFALTYNLCPARTLHFVPLCVSKLRNSDIWVMI